MCVVGATTQTRATRPSESIRWATWSPNVVLPAAGVAEARKAPPSWANTSAAAACCQARRGRSVGQDGSVRERTAGPAGSGLSYGKEPQATNPGGRKSGPAPHTPRFRRSLLVQSSNWDGTDADHALHRPRLPLGLVGITAPRRASLALRRPARMAPRHDRAHRGARAVRVARLHRRAHGHRLPLVPLARHAVRDRAARARARDRRDVPRRRRRAAAGARARVGGPARTAVRA